MNRTELRALMLESIERFYENMSYEDIPVEYALAVNIEKKDVIIFDNGVTPEDISALPKGYVFVILLDLYESTVTDAVEYILRQNK